MKRSEIHETNIAMRCDPPHTPQRIQCASSSAFNAPAMANTLAADVTSCDTTLLSRSHARPAPGFPGRARERAENGLRFAGTVWGGETRTGRSATQLLPRHKDEGRRTKRPPEWSPRLSGLDSFHGFHCVSWISLRFMDFTAFHGFHCVSWISLRFMDFTAFQIVCAW